MTFLYGPLHMDMPVLADRQEFIYIRSVQRLEVVWNTYLERWMDSERTLVLVTRLDDAGQDKALIILPVS